MAVKIFNYAVIGLIASAFSLPTDAQELYTYTQNPASGNVIALGYPPPVPVDSTLPVDGFRSYQSLHARHQDLMLQHDFIAGQVVGQTIAGRDIWAYVLSDPGRDTRNAGPESSALVNGGLHAREWASPELATGLIEAYAAHAGDRHLYDYLIDNVSFTVLPVNNVDGFLQTQRYPTQVLIGLNPTVATWPRDGRMRRKNMNSVDEFLFTDNDHLSGVDLNRNNSPFWASTTSSSFNPNSLVYHGTRAFSEPENLALLAAAELADTERLRWYQDSHSFTQVFFSKYTFNQRRNRIQDRLLASYRNFHNELSIQRHGQPRVYQDLPDAPGVGIGVTADYFAYTYEIPSWTLEIEPRNGGADYGGFGANHDGFVLPDSEVARMREDMAITHAVVTYKQAGPPAVQSLQIIDERGITVYSAEWQYTGNRQRQVTASQNEALLPGFDYQLIVSFDKPMRWDGETGPELAPGHRLVPFAPFIRIGNTGGENFQIDTASGRWLGDSGSDDAYLNYRYDTFAVEFSVPDAINVIDNTTSLTLSIAAQDFTGQALDANPATVIDWVSGSWSGYENSDGQISDVGGSDQTLSVQVSPQRSIRAWLLRRR